MDNLVATSHRFVDTLDPVTDLTKSPALAGRVQQCRLVLVQVSGCFSLLFCLSLLSVLIAVGLLCSGVLLAHDSTRARWLYIHPLALASFVRHVEKFVFLILSLPLPRCAVARLRHHPHACGTSSIVGADAEEEFVPVFFFFLSVLFGTGDGVRSLLLIPVVLFDGAIVPS